MRLTPLLALLLSIPAMGANWYVSKVASGTNAGTSWTNAWNEMSQVNFSSLACGDTVWIAGGTNYTTSLTGSKSCTAGNVLTFNRVLSSDAVPVASPGWSSAFDSQVILPNITVPGPAAYMTFNGRKFQAGGTTGSAGIQVLIPGTVGDGIDASDNGSTGPAVDHLTWAYIHIWGGPCVLTSTCTGSGVIGVNVMPRCSTANRTNLLFDHMIVERTGEAFRGCGWDTGTVQYSHILITHNDGPQHEDILYSNPPYNNVTWRWNVIEQSPSDGIFFEFGGANNLLFYRNVFWNSQNSLMTTKTPGTYGPILIYNNTFVSTTGPCSSSCTFLDDNGSTMTGVQSLNNAYYYVINSMTGSAGETSNHNAYSYTTINGGPAPTETGSFSFNPGTQQPFVSVAAGNFRLISNSTVLHAAGTNLGSPYNADMDGNTAPSSGAWDIGAFQFAATAASSFTGTISGTVKLK